MCRLYDIQPAFFGQVNNLVTQDTNYGKQRRVSDFFSASINARVGSGLRIGGGLDTGRTLNDNCFVVDSPQQLLYCRVITPFSAQTQLKLFGSYPLPGRVSLSGVVQSLPGPVILANYPAPNSAIVPSLGRNLAAGTRGTATVPLIQPQTRFEARQMQLDLRLSKQFTRRSRIRLQANLDVYNVLNANTILAINNTYGGQWRRPTSILDARLVQIGGQLTF